MWLRSRHSLPSPDEPRFLKQVTNACRLKRLAYRTELSYVAWVRRSILFHSKRHPKDIRSIQELLGHSDVGTTMTYTHVMVKPGLGARSPLDG